MNRIVKLILFDVTRKGKVYRDLDLGYHCDPSVDEAYIHDEDGPWGAVEVGDEYIDFQIYADPDSIELKMSAVLMYQNPGEEVWCRGDFLYEPDIIITNIRVQYQENSDKVDYCHCNHCDIDVLVEVGQDVCPICGKQGCMSDVEQEMESEDALDLLWA